MKTLLTLVLVAFALTAKAGNDGPQASPPAPVTVLAEYSISGGLFVPPGYPSAYRYQILTDGLVQVKTYIQGQNDPTTRRLKKLSPRHLAHIEALVQAIEPGDMVDPNPNEPGCQDGPTFTYMVYKADAKIIIGQNYNCKELSRPNGGDADKELMRILAAIKNLADKK
jgi:hypothetical protein